MALLCLAEDLMDLKSAPGADPPRVHASTAGRCCARGPQGHRRDGGAPARRHPPQPGPDARGRRRRSSTAGRSPTSPTAATRSSRPRWRCKLGEICVTEAGFGFDLGAEKFFDIKCGYAGLRPDGVVLVATARALKYHGGVPMSAVDHEDLPAIKRGMANLEKHVEDIHLFGVPVVVALNRFPSDTDAELAAIVEHCAELGVPAVPRQRLRRGRRGRREAGGDARRRPRPASRPSSRPLYDWAAPVKAKIHTIATRMYGAERVVYTKRADGQIAQAEALGYGGLPICMAKTQRSLSDDPPSSAGPRDFTVTVGEVRISGGRGFLVPITGDILTMPGLPRVPSAERIDVDADRAE
mgnify:CR=1 FL=1